MNPLIIGSGSSGIAAAMALEEKGIAWTMVDRRDTIGGVWSPNTDSNHTPMYDHMRTNLPYAIMAYPGHPPKDIAEAHPFPDPPVIQKYLEDQYQALQKGTLYLRHEVLDIFPSTDKGHKVMVRTPSNDTLTWHFSHIFVAKGNFAVPTIPTSFASYDHVIHANTYRNGQAYAGKKVLVVGCGSSGGEIAIELALHAREVDMYVRNPESPKVFFSLDSLRSLGIHIIHECPLEQISSYDHVICATGYQHHLPFLNRLDVEVTDVGGIAPLHKMILVAHCPTIALLCIQTKVIPFGLALIQSRWTLHQWQTHGEGWTVTPDVLPPDWPPEFPHLLGHRAIAYLSDLCEDAGLNPSWVRNATLIALEVVQERKKNPSSFRDHEYEGVVQWKDIPL